MSGAKEWRESSPCSERDGIALSQASSNDAYESRKLVSSTCSFETNTFYSSILIIENNGPNSYSYPRLHLENHLAVTDQARIAKTFCSVLQTSCFALRRRQAHHEFGISYASAITRRSFTGAQRLGICRRAGRQRALLRKHLYKQLVPIGAPTLAHRNTGGRV